MGSDDVSTIVIVMSAASRRSLGAQETISISPGDPLRDLFEACKHGDVSRVRTLVTPQNVNARDTAGRKSSPLHFAAGYGRREAVEILLNAGANVHARDDGGLIPLHNACSFGHAEVVSLLLRASFDPVSKKGRRWWYYTVGASCS